MDPNAALKKIRQLQRDLELAYRQPDETPHEAHELGRELAEAVADLDEWLAKGGFLPADWTKDTRPANAWSAPVVDSALYVEVEHTNNIVLVMPASMGQRRRQATITSVDALHNQLEEARSFVRGGREVRA